MKRSISLKFYSLITLMSLILVLSCNSNDRGEKISDKLDDCVYFNEQGIARAEKVISNKKIILPISLEEYTLDEREEFILRQTLLKDSINVEFYSINSPWKTFDICEQKGFNKVMFPYLKGKLGYKFIDSMINNSKQQLREEIKKELLINEQDCDNKNQLFKHNSISTFLEENKGKNSYFWFLENHINSSVIKLTFQIDTFGVVKELIFTERNYILNEDDSKMEEIESFIKKMFLNKKLYFKCSFDRQSKKFKKEEFIVFRWEEERTATNKAQNVHID